MKTSINHLTTVRLSQSDAILESIQAGFFELFFGKAEIGFALAKNDCKSIRVELVVREGNGSLLKVYAIEPNGRKYCIAQSSVASGGVTPARITATIRRCTVEFSACDLQLLLSQPDCVGVRFFPGLLSVVGSNEPTLIAVGVRSGGFDIAEGPGYLRSLWARTLCAAA